MSDPRLVFVAGKKRSGKDFVADRLVEERGYKKLHIVEGWLRDWGAKNGLDPDRWEEWKSAHRAAIQRDASIERARDPMVLLNRFENVLANEMSRGPVVVTAVRFTNEALWGMERGAFVVKVETPDEVRRERFIAAGDDLALMDDPFEVDLGPEFPCHIVVQGTWPAGVYAPTIVDRYHWMLSMKAAMFGQEKTAA